MRWTRIGTLAMVFGVGAGMSGCGEPSPTAKRVQDKLGETWDAMKTWGVEKRDEFLKSASPKLDELKQAFADAKVSAAKTSAESAQRLEEGWNGVQQKFDAMKAATGTEWAKHRDAFVEAYEAYKRKLASPDPK